MAISLASLRNSTALSSPRILIHGVAGIGKTNFAANAPNAAFILTEDGLGTLNATHFPLAKTFDEVMEALAALRLTNQLPAPARIRVRPQGRYTEITAYEFSPCSATSAAARPGASAGSMSAGPLTVRDGTGGFATSAPSPVRTSAIGGSA